MDGEINEALREQQNVFDHVAIDFGSLITVKVVPAQAPQARGKCLLHFLQLIGRQKRRQNYETIGLQLGG
jgi:hypothetical protein